MTRESFIQNDIRLGVGDLPDVRLFRNTQGEGWMGRVVSHRDGLLVLAEPRYVTFGLHVGSSDLIGWRSRLITPQDVGTVLAQFVGLEVKTTDGRSSADQIQWHKVLTAVGALSAVVRSPDDARTALTQGV